MIQEKIYWPDQKIDSQGRKPRRRAIPYWKIQELAKKPRREDILALYDNEDAARQALWRLKKLKNLLPGGVWHFYVRDITMTEGDRKIVRTALLGVFFLYHILPDGSRDPEVHWMFNNRINMTQAKIRFYDQWDNQPALADKSWVMIEDQV